MAILTHTIENNEPLISNKLSTGRLLSLDVFRGITVAAMILVNNPGSWATIYPPLRHAEWNGATPTDLIFPFFLFIVGVSITYSLSGKKEQVNMHQQVIWQILKRSLILFGLGMFLHLFPAFDFSAVRIPGVLQRIAVVFCISACMFLKTSLRTQIYVTALLLLIYSMLLTRIPVPGVGYPNMEPETSLAAWLDNLLLHGHLWQQAKVWDPEGILSTLPAIATCFTGVFAGQWLRSGRENATKVVWLFVAGNAALVGGLVWDYWLPINKSLWTSSFVLYTSGIALHFLAICFWLIDVQGYKAWTKPFLVFGVNAITVFFLSGLIPRIMGLIKVSGPEGTAIGLQAYIYQTFFTPYFSPVNASLTYALTFVGIWMIILWIMYNKRIIIKV